MGTNYYLHRQPNPCPTCGRQDDTEFHIGKSSMGWVWVWRGYRDDHPLAPLTTPDEWEARLRREVADGAVIRDEYGQDVPLDELLGMVESKADSQHRNSRVDPRYTIAVGGSDVTFAEFC